MDKTMNGGNPTIAHSGAHITKKDALIALFLAVIFFLLAYFSLTPGCFWGDDYAAYISEGIAIADGRLDEQTQLNTLMHPSPLPKEAVGQPLVYVWGYPLLLSVVYLIFGFDRVDYSTIINYKLPSVIALALIAFVLYFFLRRRFGRKLSFILTVVFCSCSELYSFLNTLYSDLVFLFFALLSLWLLEVFSEEKQNKKRIALAFIFGISLWYTCEVRLNGSAVLITCIISQLISVLRDKKYRKLRLLCVELIPYAVFIIFKTVSEALLASPTSNASDLSGADIAVLLGNLRIYFQLIGSWFALLWNNLLLSPLYSVLRRFSSVSFDDLALIKNVLVCGSGALCLLGIVTNGIKRNLHLTLLCVIYLTVASMLPYTQGMRYIYPLLPVLLMFCGYGISVLAKKLPDKLINSRVLIIVTALWSLVCIYPVVSSDLTVMRGETAVEVIIDSVDAIYMQNAYSESAVEVYNYIQHETDPDCTIAFFTPRGLYLNTERFSIKPDVNGHSMDEADYCLDYLKTGDYNLSPGLEEKFEPVFSNDEFVLFKRITGDTQ